MSLKSTIDTTIVGLSPDTHNQLGYYYYLLMALCFALAPVLFYGGFNTGGFEFMSPTLVFAIHAAEFYFCGIVRSSHWGHNDDLLACFGTCIWLFCTPCDHRHNDAKCGLPPLEHL
jgi:hypothetical protein